MYYHNLETSIKILRDFIIKDFSLMRFVKQTKIVEILKKCFNDFETVYWNDLKFACYVYYKFTTGDIKELTISEF